MATLTNKHRKKNGNGKERNWREIETEKEMGNSIEGERELGTRCFVSSG